MAAELKAFMHEIGDPLYDPEVDSNTNKKKKKDKPAA